MVYNGWHPGRAMRMEGMKQLEGNRELLGKERHKSWGRRVSHLWDETTPSFLSGRIQGRTSDLCAEVRCRDVYQFFLQARGFQVCVVGPRLAVCVCVVHMCEDVVLRKTSLKD